MACWWGGLNIIDISNPTQPFLANTWVYGEDSNNLFYLNNKLYLTDMEMGLFILDVSDVNNIILQGHYDTYTNGRDISVVGNYLYQVERDPACLKIFDISDKAKPILMLDQTILPDVGGSANEITI